MSVDKMASISPACIPLMFPVLNQPYQSCFTTVTLSICCHRIVKDSFELIPKLIAEQLPKDLIQLPVTKLLVCNWLHFADPLSCTLVPILPFPLLRPFALMSYLIKYQRYGFCNVICYQVKHSRGQPIKPCCFMRVNTPKGVQNFYISFDPRLWIILGKQTVVSKSIYGSN